MVLTARAAQFVEAFLPLLLLQSIGVSTGVTAVVLVAQQVSSTLANAAAGWLVRRLGLIGVVRWGLLGSALAVAILAIADSALVAAAGAAVFGATSGAWRTAVQAMVPTTLTAPESVEGGGGAASRGEEPDAVLRSRAFGAIFWAANAGAIMSAGAGAAGLPLRSLFAAQAISTVAAFVLSWTIPQHIDQVHSLAVAPDTQRPTRADVKRARRETWVLIVAFVPATMLMFQAFGGLAVVMPDDAYRQMVLVNAVVLVVGQPLTVPLLRVLGATTATVAAIVAMAVGIAAQAPWPDALGWTVVWTLGELIVVIVPGALVTAAAPTAQAALYLGRFQVAQGIAAAAALLAGPLLAGSGTSSFMVACVATGAIGVAGVLVTRRVVSAAWRQPLTCPCGALFCVCSRSHTACATPSPVLTHQALPVTTEPTRSTA